MNKALFEVDALIDILNKKGISLDVKGGSIRYRGPAHAMTMKLKHEIKKHKDVLLERLSKATVIPWPHFTSNIAYLYKPFPLTDLQQAYLVGEQEFYQQRTIAYNYQQYRVTNFSYDKFLSAIDRLIKTRDILRTTYFSNGTQQINREIQYAPQFEDLTHLNEEQITSRIDKKRIDIVNDLAPLDEGPPLAISIQKTRSDYRIHIIVRLIAFDGITLNLIYRDLIGAYSKLDYVPPVPELSYRDYVLGIEEFRKSDAYRDSLKYWLKRTALLPPAPDLPRVKVPGQDSNFKRKSGKLRSDKWGKLSENARLHGKPINVVLFAIYVDTLKRWSRNKDFTIVLLSANRPQQEVDTSGVLGNCSTTSLIEVSNNNGRFIERIDQLQCRIYEDLQHNAVSGVEVIRHIQSKSSSKEAPGMPVVFTSGIGLLGSADHFDLLIPDDHWELVGSRLSTPQVWLDQQVYLEKGELVFNWDYAENVFPTGMIDEMFDFYSVQLERITSSPKAWDYDEIDLPGKNFIRRNCVNQTKKHLNVKPLHYPLIANYGAFPSQPALVSDVFCAGYKELFHLCCLISHSISKSGIDQNSLVGVFVLRKDTQIISAVSCLFGGNAYLPLDPKMPVDRVIWILRQSCAAAVIVDEATAAKINDDIGCTKIMLPKIDREAKHYRSAQSHKDRLPDVRVDCIAYVIYTSGSTGRPKGVVIDHKGASNTIEDIVERFSISKMDRILALSSMGFDLSVFDVFGALSCGATIVVPDDSDTPDPEKWVKSVKKYGVSIWNSVPALLEMTLEYLGEDNSSNLASLRLIMLSGDWIPLPLVQKVKKFCPQAKLVGLGGATEASIWSNYFEIEKLDQNWTSIPYGYPLSNQYFRILDKKLRDVPAWVIGDLYIGGAGLAKSYLNDNKKTDESFIFHPKTGDRLYRTGDIGRYINHDTIEFCGREDSQIKIRGFRVELGEIENTICEIEGIDGAVVTVNGESDNEKTLQAFLKCRSKNACDEAVIRANLVRKLPDYMIPAGITFVDSIPLSANGKVDRKALKTRNTNTKNDAKAVYVKPETHGQIVLSSIWKELLHIKVIGIDDDFFGAGGNSLLAVMLFSRIRETFGNKLPLSSLFSNNTIRSQAKLLEQQNSSEQHSNLETLREGKGETILILFHPVGGDILCYRELVTYLPDDFTIVGVRSLESAGPQSSKSSLEEITASYVRQINQRYPGTELSLAGWSMGGVIAYEAAQQLMKNGSPVSAVIMIDSWTGCKDREKVLTKAEMARSFFVDICMNQNSKQLLESTTYGKDFEYFVKLHQIMLDHNYIDSSVECEQLYKLYGIYRENMKTLERYTPSPLDCNIVIFTANRVASKEFTNLQRFNEKNYKYLQNTSSTNRLDGDHFSIMQGENIRSIAKTIRENIVSGNRI